MIARRILALPALAIAGIYVAIVLAVYAGAPIPITIAQLVSVVWALALYLVAKNVLRERSRFGRVAFSIAIRAPVAELLSKQAEEQVPVVTSLTAPTAGAHQCIALSAPFKTENRDALEKGSGH
jgi:hypothetical protein